MIPRFAIPCRQGAAPLIPRSNMSGRRTPPLLRPSLASKPAHSPFTRRPLTTAASPQASGAQDPIKSDKILSRAYLLMNDGINDASRRLFELYLSTEGKNHSKQDPVYLQVLQSRSLTLARSGKPVQAAEGAEQVSQLFLDAAHDATYCDVGVKIGHLLRRVGLVGKARTVLERTIELIAKHLPGDTLAMANAVQLYATLEKADLHRALQLSRTATEMKERIIGRTEPWKLAENNYFLMRTHVKLQDVEQGRALLDRSKRLLQSIDTREPKTIRDAASPLVYEFEGSFAYYQGNWLDAQRNYEQSLDLKTRLFGELTRETHSDLFNLHKIACARGLPHEKSQEFFLKSKYISDKYAESYDFLPPDPRDLLFVPPKEFLSDIYPLV